MKVQAVLLLLVAGCAARPVPTRPRAPHRAPAMAAPKPAPAPEPVAVVAPPPAPVAPPPPSGETEFVPTAADQVFARRVLALIDEIAVAVEHNQDDCGRMVDELERILQRNQDLLLIGKQMKGNPPRDNWLRQQAEGRVSAAAPRLLAGFQKCQNDARMLALLRKLGS